LKVSFVDERSRVAQHSWSVSNTFSNISSQADKVVREKVSDVLSRFRANNSVRIFSGKKIGDVSVDPQKILGLLMLGVKIDPAVGCVDSVESLQVVQQYDQRIKIITLH
jgi:hypothetical protein